jgi:hypothetical protein
MPKQQFRQAGGVLQFSLLPYCPFVYLELHDPDFIIEPRTIQPDIIAPLLENASPGTGAFLRAERQLL